jgi:hypothetical protein
MLKDLRTKRLKRIDVWSWRLGASCLALSPHHVVIVHSLVHDSSVSAGHSYHVSVHVGLRFSRARIGVVSVQWPM